jgi:DNA replication protein DnaC
MSNTITITKMKDLKLNGMRRAFEAALETRECQNMTQDEFISYLVQNEWEQRQNQRITMSLWRAKFRYNASVEQISFSKDRNLDKNAIMRLADCSYLDKKENIIITGSTGVGKSFITSALGHQACIKGYKVMYCNTAKLFTKLKMAKGDGSYTREISRIEKQDLLILDDFGLQPLDQQIRLALLEIIEDRHGKKSTMISSQIPVNKWYELLEEQTIADAILDRIVHTSHRIELKGESQRKKQANKQKQEENDNQI